MTKIKEIDPKDIGITEEMIKSWDKQKTYSFSFDQLDLMADLTPKQLEVMLTFTSDQLDAIRNARERNAKRYVH